ncbi:MAG: type II secretion system F family protein, partial [Candidatus Omnitrophota bacterium]
MPKYVYKAKKGPTEIVEGKIEAENQKRASIKLSQMNLYPISIEEETALFIKSSGKGRFFKRRFKLKDLSNFTRQLSNLLDSGLTMLNALGILIEQTNNPVLVLTLQLLRDDVKDGATFSQALKKHPRIFNSLYVNMVASGEVSGSLESVLARLADFLEKDEQLLSKVKASMAYPAIMAFVGCVTVFVLLTFVAPRLTEVFVDMGQALPLLTRLLIGVSNFLARFWLLIIAGIVIMIGMFSRWAQTSEGRKVLDERKLKLPLFGAFISKTEIARFGRTLGTLVGNGVPIIQALGVATNTLDNTAIKQDMEQVKKDVVDGGQLSNSIKK